MLRLMMFFDQRVRLILKNHSFELSCAIMKTFNLPPLNFRFRVCLMGTCRFLLLFHAVLASKGESPASQNELRVLGVPTSCSMSK